MPSTSEDLRNLAERMARHEARMERLVNEQASSAPCETELTWDDVQRFRRFHTNALQALSGLSDAILAFETELDR